MSNLDKWQVGHTQIRKQRETQGILNNIIGPKHVT